MPAINQFTVLGSVLSAVSRIYSARFDAEMCVDAIRAKSGCDDKFARGRANEVAGSHRQFTFCGGGIPARPTG
jgi:hypothetical protein